VARAISFHPWPGLALWLCPLGVMPVLGRQAWLDAKEAARARRFMHEVHRRRYVAAHVALRERLGAFASRLPAEIPLAVDALDKPFVADDAALQFNLSHSDDWALLGIARGAPMGVDIECRRPVEDAHALARRHFTPQEQQAVQAAAEGAERDRVFLRVWTRKEACLKALGLGLRLGPSSFEVGADSGLAIATLMAPQGPVQVEVWSVPSGIDAEAAVARLRR
jgi:4'-phosphopantetheinyl transferase